MDATATATAETHPGTIIEGQIGRRAFFMLGAKDLFLTTHEGCDGLSFRIRGCEKGNFMRITLDRATDTYVIELAKVRGLTCKVADTRTMVHADQMHATIERMTGLYTSL